MHFSLKASHFENITILYKIIKQNETIAETLFTEQYGKTEIQIEIILQGRSLNCCRRRGKQLDFIYGIKALSIT